MRIRCASVVVALVSALATTGVVRGQSETPRTYESTPVASVRLIYQTSDLHAAVRILSSTILANEAIVVIEGTPMDQPGRGTPLLLQRFSFGWQPVAVVDAPCKLDGRGLSASEKATLASGLHLERDTAERCFETQRDRGPLRDVEAIRRRMFGPVVPYAIVADGFAYAREYGDGGGCGLFRKAGAGWEVIGSCKGSLGPPGVVERYHIPLPTQCALGIAETGCRGKDPAGTP